MWKSYNFYEFTTAMRMYGAASVLILLLYGCKSPYHISTVDHSLVSVSDTKFNDSIVYRMVLPYRQTMDSLMNEVISYSEVDLEKGLPESTLGNFVCDIVLEYANRNTTTHVDFCMLNNGGLRIPSISKGSILMKNIYELLPFENTLEVIEIEGTVCKKLLDDVAKQGGAPVSGVRFTIVSDKAIDININGKPYNPDQTYFVLTNDYMANGGNPIMKESINRTSLGVKLRDSVIKVLREKKQTNQSIKTIKDGRIVKI